MKNRLVRLLISVLITVAWMAILVLMTNPDHPSRILVMLGGTMPQGLIQGFTYLLFVFGMMEIMYISRKLSYEADAFSAKLLPEQENWVLSIEDVNQLKLNMQKLEHTQQYFLTDLIKKACTKYRLGRSSSEVLGLMESQINIYRSELDANQSFIRYVAWAIPSVGFIGTVL